MLQALRILADIRSQGAKPEAVIVDVGTSDQRRWWAEEAPVVSIAVPDALPLRDLDARPLVGCDVIVVGLTGKDRLRAVVERICAHASMVTVLVGGSDELLGHVWERGKGWRKFGDGPALQEAA